MIEYYFLPAIVILGIITSFEDLKFGKIRNKWIIASIIFSFVMYLFLFLGKIVEPNEIFLVSINFAISIAFSFALWNFRFWSAGDGKLFIAYSALIPLEAYKIPFVSFFPGFDLFVNTIVLFFIYLFVRSIPKIPFRKIKKSVLGSIRGLPSVLMAIFSISWLIRLVGGKIFSLNGVIYSFIIYAAAYYAVNLAVEFLIKKFRIKKIKPIHFYAALVAARLIFDFNNILNLNSLYSVILSALLYSLVLRAAYNVVYLKSYKEVEISKIKKGDVIMRMDKSSSGKSLLDFIEIGPEGVSNKNLNEIKNLQKSGKLKIKKIPVAETVPFGPAMFAGAAITIAFANIGNLIYLAYNILIWIWGLF